MTVRNATLGDLGAVLAIYKRAREYMRQTGNPNQWKTYHPDEATVREDISLGQLYLLCEGDTVHGVFAFIPGIDPTYNEIDGAWLNNEPYAAVHRVASAGLMKGVLGHIMAYCSERCDNIRIDTHLDNKIMQHQLTKLGFKHCGTIILDIGEPREAYHLSR